MRQKICGVEKVCLLKVCLLKGCLLIVSLALCVVISATGARGQQAQQPSVYAGEERREIKSLSREEIEQLLQGHGMGLAKAAELNHYPGPRHVLELGERLKLTPEQRTATEGAFARMREEAMRLGRQIVARERELDAMFAKGEIDAGKLRASTAEIARLQGNLRAAHLAAHLETRRILSPQQIAKYDELRGYAGAGKQTPPSPHEHKHGKH
ncbi:MAG TPA: periplasmic heavy metal sensor [Pyrinomonadaceae bacterium]|jgi:Spy/CpxP family protein refolding chaperone